MTKTGFYAAYFLSPLVPIAVYLIALGTAIDIYAFSVIFGIAAFTFLCAQFVLASRPARITDILGAKQLVHLHSSAPLLIVALAAAHLAAKNFAGLDTRSPQAVLGAAGLAITVLACVLAVLFMANTFWMKLQALQKLKAWVYARAGLNYQRARLLHNITLAAALLLFVHAALAASSSFALNPLGFIFLAGELLFSLGFYLRYRLRGRAAAKPRQK